MYLVDTYSMPVPVPGTRDLVIYKVEKNALPSWSQEKTVNGENI